MIDESLVKDAIFHMHRRYAKQWNDIELDRNRSLSEHTHEVYGAQVAGASRRFILHAATDQTGASWILEVLYARGFSVFHPGWSCGKNPLRSTDDIRSIHLHWSGEGRTNFAKWIEAEKLANQSKGEAAEYVGKQSTQTRKMTQGENYGEHMDM